MPGRMGGRRATARKLLVVEANKEQNLLVVKGAVPGAKGGYLLIKKADFASRPPAEKTKESTS